METICDAKCNWQEKFLAKILYFTDRTEIGGGIEFLDLSLEIPPELKELEVLWTTLTLDLRSRKYPLPQHSPDLELLMENLGSVETTLFTGRLLSHEHDYFLS